MKMGTWKTICNYWKYVQRD